jgi:hypothetical protein
VLGFFFNFYFLKNSKMTKLPFKTIFFFVGTQGLFGIFHPSFLVIIKLVEVKFDIFINMDII